MKKFVLPILLVGLTAVNAVAVTSAFNQPSIPGGLGLDDYVTNTWDINTEGEAWLSSELLLQLTSGDIYQNPTAGGNGPPTSPTGARSKLPIITPLSAKAARRLHSVRT